MSINKENYVVYVKETYTRKYYVNASSIDEAKEKYSINGITSQLLDKDIDRQILSVDLASNDK